MDSTGIRTRLSDGSPITSPNCDWTISMHVIMSKTSIQRHETTKNFILTILRPDKTKKKKKDILLLCLGWCRPSSRSSIDRDHKRLRDLVAYELFSTLPPVSHKHFWIPNVSLFYRYLQNIFLGSTSSDFQSYPPNHSIYTAINHYHSLSLSLSLSLTLYFFSAPDSRE